MERGARALAAALTAAGLRLFSGVGGQDALFRYLADRPPEERMRNVLVLKREQSVPARAGAEAEPAAWLTGAGESPVEEPPEAVPSAGEQIVETTIEGGLQLKNETSYWVDAAQTLAGGPRLTLPADDVQILIIHTHASEAYTQAGLDRYTASDRNRTEDTQFNIVRIGDELTEILTEAGLNVIHDRGIYDFPSYTGSYTRSGEAIAQYLASCPGIRIVLDIHRDALGSEGVVYKTMAEEEGVVASQIMLLVGTDESGLQHPHWRDNLALALYLQNAVNRAFPTLMRPIDLVSQRYNQHLTPGSLIVEVGSSGNTLREALAAIRLFGRAAAPALLELVETGQAEDM